MLSLYFHIPFCERKCLYCDFYSIESRSAVAPFLEALCAEIASAASIRPGAPVDTLFFGGGTPSLLAPGQLERILREVGSRWTLQPDAEITVETNPGTVDREKLRAFRSLGVNRLSIGVQSFDDRELRFLSRIHSSSQAVQCVEDARQAGFDNLSLDLIYSLPGQTLGRWLTTLEQALTLRPDHLSAYSLIVEENTPLHRMVQGGQVTPNTLEAEAALYERTMEIMASRGYEHYEVSNYARQGFRCRHNLAYWHHGEYLGFGPSAHSFLRDPAGNTGRRWANAANLSTYIANIRRGITPVTFEESIGTGAMRREKIFLGLRGDGLDLRVIEEPGDGPVAASSRAVLEGLVREGLAVRHDGCLRLTDRGYLLCDEIARRLIS